MSTLNQMLNAMEALQGAPALPTEYRLHPDDIAELRSSYRREVSIGRCDLQPLTHLFGLRIVADENAERLPRKPR